jgi:hypothetical protein
MKKLLFTLIFCSLLGSLIYWNKPNRIEFVSESTFHSDMKMFASSALSINTTGCNLKQLKNEARIELDEYTFESMAYKPYEDFKDKNIVIAEFGVYGNEQYRIINISQGFINPLTINIYDKKHKLIQTNTYNYSIDKFDFKAESSGTYQIEFIPSNEDKKNINKKCVAFSLGYK